MLPTWDDYRPTLPEDATVLAHKLAGALGGDVVAAALACPLEQIEPLTMWADGRHRRAGLPLSPDRAEPAA